MNELKIFKNEEFGEIRTVQLNNETYFVGKDIATALGYKNTKDALLTHVDESDKRVIQRSEITTIENNLPKDVFPVNFVSADIPNRGLTIINESGLYALIFGSKLESAKRFKHWVTSEVLPSIRKTGQYQIPNLSKEMQAIVLLDTRTVKMEKRLDKLEFDIPLYGSEADELSSHVKRRGVAILGGKKAEAYKDSNIRSKVYRDIYDQIKREFGIYSDDGKPKSYKALKRKYIYDAHELVDAYEAPKYLMELIHDANAQISLQTAV